jgi:hypothetical protein
LKNGSSQVTERYHIDQTTMLGERRMATTIDSKHFLSRRVSPKGFSLFWKLFVSKFFGSRDSMRSGAFRLFQYCGRTKSLVCCRRFGCFSIAGAPSD